MNGAVLFLKMIYRNPNRPYQVNHLFDRQGTNSVINHFDESSRENVLPARSQSRKPSYRKQYNGSPGKPHRPVWEQYGIRGQKYLSIGGFKG